MFFLSLLLKQNLQQQNNFENQIATKDKNNYDQTVMSIAQIFSLFLLPLFDRNV